MLLAIARRSKFGNALVPHHCVGFNLVGRAMAVKSFSLNDEKRGFPAVTGRTPRVIVALGVHTPGQNEINSES